MDTISLLIECIERFMEVWKSHDWKSRTDWQDSRRSLLNKLNMTILKYDNISIMMGCER